MSKKKPSVVLIFLLLLLGAAACLPAEIGSSFNNPFTSNDLALVPAGWFLMGENDQRPSNTPQRRVYLDAYYIQLTEVTRAEFAELIEEAGYEIQGWGFDTLAQDGDLPVTNTLWKDADAYCSWLGMRLPSEAEWEKAARGEDGRRYPWGDQWDKTKANTLESGIGGTLPVGSYPLGTSPYGLMDMTGNAAEWVADYYDRDYYTYAPERNPRGPVQVLDHVLRGGSFDDPADWGTTYFRNSSHSAQSNPRAGFRCAKSANRGITP